MVGSDITMMTMKPALSVALFCLSTLSQGQMPASGTIITVIPANGGIAVASDTRQTYPSNKNCDGIKKLFIPKLRKNTIVFETGAGFQLKAVRPVPSDVCRWVKSAEPSLDISHCLVRGVDAKPSLVLTKGEVEVIGKHCLAEVKTFARTYGPESMKRYRNDYMFTAVIVSYDVKRAVGLVGAFYMKVDSEGVPSLKEPIEWHEYSTANKASHLYFGDGDYVDRYVIGYHTPNLGPYLALNGRTVSQVSVSDAKAAAFSLVKATEETTKRILSPNNSIGGPIDVATITKDGAKIERQ